MLTFTHPFLPVKSSLNYNLFAITFIQITLMAWRRTYTHADKNDVFNHNFFLISNHHHLKYSFHHSFMQNCYYISYSYASPCCRRYHHALAHTSAQLRCVSIAINFYYLLRSTGYLTVSRRSPRFSWIQSTRTLTHTWWGGRKNKIKTILL